MAKISVTGSAGSDYAKQRSQDNARAAAAPPTARERRRDILAQLDHFKLTPIDLFSWDGLLELLELTKHATHELQREIFNEASEAALRRAEELDAGGIKHRELLRARFGI